MGEAKKRGTYEQRKQQAINDRANTFDHWFGVVLMISAVVGVLYFTWPAISNFFTAHRDVVAIAEGR